MASPIAIDPLLERGRELAALKTSVDAALERRGRVVVVEGAPGIGKTRLIAAAREAGRARGMQVCSARASELERSLPHGIARQLFESKLHGVSSAQREQALSGAASLAVAALDPRIGSSDPGFAPDAAFRAQHGLYWLAVNLAAEQALLLCVDDAQWCDPPSARWLAYLAARLDELSLLVVLGVRTGETAADPAVASLLTDPHVEVIRPAPLSVTAVQGLTVERFESEPDHAFVAACHEMTGGNPFLVRELLTAVAAEGAHPTAEFVELARTPPASVARSLSHRLERLGRQPVELAVALATLGGEAPLEDAARLAGQAAGQAMASAEALVRAEMLEERRDEAGELHLEFRHPLVTAAVYAELGLAERERGHRAAAAQLAERGAGASEIAGHLLLAGTIGEPWAIAALRQAGSEALAGGAPDLAIVCLQRAVKQSADADADAELIFELGVAEARVGAPAAVDHLREAFERLADPRLRARAGFELGHCLLTTGRPLDGLRAFDEAVGTAASVDRELELRLEAMILPSLRANVFTAATGPRRAERFRTLTGETTAARALLVAMAADDAAGGRRGADAVGALAERLAGGGRLLADESCDSPVVLALAAALVFSDRLGQAESHLSDALEEAAAKGSIVSFSLLCTWRSFARLRAGNVTGALTDAETAVRISDEHGLVLDRALTIACLISCLRERGSSEAAREMAEGFPLAAYADAGSANVLLYSRGLLRADDGRVDKAVEDLLACGEHLARWQSSNPIVLPWRSSAAIALAAAGDADRASALIDEELELSMRYGAPSAIGIALRAQGMLARGGRRIELLTDALARLETSEARLEHTRTQIELAAAQRAEGLPRAARTTLEHALETAHRAGALALADRARSELIALGARPRRAALSGVEALTPSERRIAEMAAGGQTNAGIAQSLFLTTRTVEMHLTNSYRKLGIGSRTQLADVLGARSA